MTKATLALSCAQGNCLAAAQSLAHKLGLPLLAGQASAERSGAYTHVLLVEEKGLSLKKNEAQAPSPTRVDFDSGALLHRIRGSGIKQEIARAVGIKSQYRPSVLDATAGLGKDAFVLAALGCCVQMLERSPLIHALLADGLCRGRQSGDAQVRESLARMDLVAGDACAYLENLTAADQRPEVIYLDPMYPPRKKSAKVKKDILLLQQVLNESMDEELEDLLALARARALKRVVLKRPGSHTGESWYRPDFQIKGKTSHFDVFVTAKD